jgi:hypothetical protein
VDFRLLYSGRVLGANKNNTRADVKHALRREFHPQLRQLWASNRNLDEYARHHCGPYFSKQPPGSHEGLTNEQFRQIGIQCISERWERNGFRFVPLVTRELSLRCSIDILFLRPEEPTYVMKSGDLDARVKTIFDALRMPDNPAETGGMGPQDDETPFFVLLEDDKLISQVSIATDQLLVLPKERSTNANDAFLVIQVRLKPVWLNSERPKFGFLFD